MTMTLSDELSWRGFINQTTLDDITVLDTQPTSFYIGIDPSADSMTIGNLVPCMLVKHLINSGHKAYLLVGGATGMIGDPDGKKDERTLKTVDEIERNKNAIVDQYKRVFDGKPFEIVDNYDWFSKINYLSFLRDVGKYVPLSNMLGRDFVQSRLGEGGSGISYAEFSYSLIQGYDFLHLFREHGVSLQVCGGDQWGNCIAGVDMIRRIESQETHVLSAPLIVNKATGVKFGKTEDGAIWLDENKTSVYKFYQFWLNADDESVEEYLKIYTMIDQQSLDEIIASHKQSPEARKAQKTLAKLVTTIVHGEEKARQAEDVTRVLFGELSVSDMSDDDLELLSHEIPTAHTGDSVINLLESSGLTSSRGDARRMMAGGAISVNGEKISEDRIIENKSLIKKGKNSFLLVK